MDGIEARLQDTRPLKELQTLFCSTNAYCRRALEDAAKILGISRKGLFLKRRRWGVEA